MSLQNVIDQTAAVLGAVAGVGKVNKYQRNATEEAVFKDAFIDDVSQRVLGWTIEREATPSRDRTIGGIEDVHTIVLDGYMAYLDGQAPSAIDFRNLVESVRAAFRANRTLNGACLEITPVSVRREDKVFLGRPLCHHAQLTFGATEYPL